MKLRNKKTGETIDVVVNPTDFNPIRLCRVNTVKSLQAVNTWEYNSLAELNEEWEDTPEEYWFVAGRGVVEHALATDDENDPFDKGRREIGNYFLSREEAELAVRKLKAWKRLKDKGFVINDWKFTPDMKHIKGNFVTIKAEIPYIVENQADLDLLFGGEE